MSKVDEMLSEYFKIKNEKYEENKLKHIEYETNYKYIKNYKMEFDLENKKIQIDANIDIEILQAINKKCEELGWLDE